MLAEYNVFNWDVIFGFVQHCGAACAPKRNETTEFLFLLCQAAVSLNEDFLSSHGKILCGELRVVLFDFANPNLTTWRRKGKSRSVQWLTTPQSTICCSSRKNNKSEQWKKKKPQNKHRITSRNNLTQAARRHSAGSVPFSASSLLLTEWRVERRPLVGYRGRRFQLAKRADRTTTVKFPLSVFHHYTSIIHIHKMITCKFSPMGKNQEQRPSQLLYTVGTN